MRSKLGDTGLRVEREGEGEGEGECEGRQQEQKQQQGQESETGLGWAGLAQARRSGTNNNCCQMKRGEEKVTEWAPAVRVGGRGRKIHGTQSRPYSGLPTVLAGAGGVGLGGKAGQAN